MRSLWSKLPTVCHTVITCNPVVTLQMGAQVLIKTRVATLDNSVAACVGSWVV